MAMPVVRIRVMGVAVNLGFVTMEMRVRPDHHRVMLVQMMAITAITAIIALTDCAVGVSVCVFKQGMAVLVRVVLCQVQPDTDGHESCGSQQLPSHRLAKKQNRTQGPDKWCS